MPGTTPNGLPTMADTDPLSSVAAAIRNLANALDPDRGAWTSYTPAWRGTTTNPTLGDGTLTGRYRKVGKSVQFTVELTFGASTTVGAGNYLFGLPVTARGSSNLPVGPAIPYDTSAPAREQAFAYLTSTTEFAVLRAGGTLVTATLPYAWAVGDRISVSGTYEAA